MSTAAQTSSGVAVEKSIATRLASIDIFRGITLAVMIFVNDLDGTKGLPWWTFHAKAEWDRMTYVDMVFPVFLFLVGMSIPIAVKARLRNNPTPLALWKHIFIRSASLVILGLILANGAEADPNHMIIGRRLWEFLGVVGASLFLSVYPGKNGAITLTEDDGISNAYLKGEIRNTNFKWDDAKRTLSWTVEGPYAGKDIFKDLVVSVFDANGVKQLKGSIEVSGQVVVPQ